MNQLDRMYRILTDSRDLLSGGYPRSHEPLQGRVAHLIQELDGGEHAREASVPVPVQTSSGASQGTAAAAFAEEAQMDEDRRFARLSRDERKERLSALEAAVRSCERCPLSLGRTLAVPGAGVLDPLVMFVGEGPGRDEDTSGLPFVGAAGQYLDKWITAIGLERDRHVYITNIVKCRPPDNRDPRPEESDACAPYLCDQIQLVRPRIIMTLGRISMRMLTGTTKGITRVHGTFFTWHGIPVVPTFHPSAVLRNPQWKRPVWEDLKVVRNWLVDNTGHAASRG